MKRSALAFVVLLLSKARAAVYYVESAPVAPYSCTAAQPCRVSDLNGPFTTADQIVFLPATTGTSSEYTFGFLNLLNPSVSLSAGTTFTGCRLILRYPSSVTCSSATLQTHSGITVLGNGANTVSSTGCNFDKSELLVVNSNVVGFTGGSVTAQTGKRIDIAGKDITVSGVNFHDATTTKPALALKTGSADSTFTLSNVQFTSWTTQNGQPLVKVTSVNGKKFVSTANDCTLDTCTIDGAALRFEVLSNGSPSTAVSEAHIAGLTLNSGSVKRGIVDAKNDDSEDKLAVHMSTLSALGTDFNSGNAFTLEAASTGITELQANTESSNSICAPSDLTNLIECIGAPAKVTVFFAGSVEGSPNESQGCNQPHIDIANTC